LNDTEYELFLLTVETVVAAGVGTAMDVYHKNNCLEHVERTERLEQTSIDVDRRLLSIEATVMQLRRVTWTAVAALIVGFVGVILALTDFQTLVP
jgi:hypothetical protein